jgi:hypothetical protein
MSRLSNGMRAAGMMRRALTEALFVARRRVAFGKPLIELPLMRRQLLKLMVPTEAARSVMLYTAVELAKADAGDEISRRRVRLLTPLLKFRACRDARRVTGDAMEVRGGAGYVEEWSDARLLRDAHLGSIWEGTSNIVALDVLRAMRKDKALEAMEFDLGRAARPTPARPRRASTTPAPRRSSSAKAGGCWRSWCAGTASSRAIRCSQWTTRSPKACWHNLRTRICIRPRDESSWHCCWPFRPRSTPRPTPTSRSAGWCPTPAAASPTW